MSRTDATNLEAILERICAWVVVGDIRITQHAQQQMVEDEISLDELFEAFTRARILENYPQHRRGACCLVHGVTSKGRSLHVVCTTTHVPLIVITVYEPKLPKWMTPTQRRQQE